MDLIEHLDKRYNRAKTIFDQWEAVLEASYYYAIPFRNRFNQPRQFQGDMKNSRLYDTSAVKATKVFVSKLHNAMTPPQTIWGFLKFNRHGQIDSDEQDEQAMLEEAEMQRVLDDYNRKLFEYIHASNFDVIVNECYYDLAVGTAALVVNSPSDDEPLLFTSIPADKLVIEEAFNGRIETWFRTWEDVRINEIKLRWPKAVLSDEMIRMAAEEPDATLDCIKEGVVFFAEDKKKPYKYCVWYQDCMMVAEPLEHNPGIVWRFQKTNNDIWGRGPIMEALPSIISLNEIARIELASANLNVFKPYMAFSDGVFNAHTFRLEPMTVIPINPIGTEGQVPLIPLPDASNPQFAEMKISDLRMQIDKLLFAENPQQSESIQPQTATSLIMKQQALAEQIGPLFSRLLQEFLAPLIERVATILDTRGILKRPKVGKKKIHFVYKSPLEQAQGQQDVATFTQYVQLLQGIMGPQATNIIVNPGEMPYLIAEKLQIDPRLLNKPEDVSRVMQEQMNMLVSAAEQAPEGEQGASPLGS